MDARADGWVGPCSTRAWGSRARSSSTSTTVRGTSSRCSLRTRPAWVRVNTNCRYDDFVATEPGRTVAPWGRSPEQLLLLYTGGTIGRPKGVMWRQGGLFEAYNASSARSFDRDRGLASVAEVITSPGPVHLGAASRAHGRQHRPVAQWEGGLSPSACSGRGGERPRDPFLLRLGAPTRIGYERALGSVCAIWLSASVCGPARAARRPCRAVGRPPRRGPGRRRPGHGCPRG